MSVPLGWDIIKHEVPSHRWNGRGLTPEVSPMPNKRNRVDRVCEQCGGTFSARPDKVAKGHSRFCGHPCFGIYQYQQHDAPILEPDGLTARVVLRSKNGSIRAYATIDATDIEFVN